MGNSGKNSNTSQFFITLDKVPQCDGKHVVFGEVVSGMEVVRAVESFGSADGEPKVPVRITDCGVYIPLFTPGSGSWYDRPDAESYSGITAEFMVRPRVGILAPNKQVANKFNDALGEHASTLLLVIDDIGGGDSAIRETALALLNNFVLDVILAAPACAGLLSLMDIPSSWKDAATRLSEANAELSKEEVFLVAKPVEALYTVVNKSWVAKRSG